MILRQPVNSSVSGRVVAEKKNQHLVPACYLKGFEAELSSEMIENPKYEAGVYVNNNLLSAGWKMKGVNNGIFTKSYFYNLESDNPVKPVVENYLSIVESDLSQYLKQVRSGQITDESLSFFSFYTTLQYIRVEKHMDIFQKLWNKIGKWADMFEGGNSNKEAVKELSKKKILTTDLGEVVHDHAHIIFNETNFPFVTSDNPVVRKEVNISDMEMLFPKDFLLLSSDKSKELPLFFFPLSPNVAYVSSAHFKTNIDVKLVVDDLLNIFYINIESVTNASNKIYSSLKTPFAGESELSKYLQSMQQDHLFVKIYGNEQRVISNISIAYKDHNSIEIILESLGKLIHFKKGDSVSLIEIIENGMSIRGMRDCSITDIDHKTGLLKVESKLKLNI